MPFYPTCSILSNLKELAVTCLGRPMLYELIEVHTCSLSARKYMEIIGV